MPLTLHDIELHLTIQSVPYDFDFSNLYKLLLPNDGRAHGFMLPSTVSKVPWSSDFFVDHHCRTIQLRDTSNGSDTSNASNKSLQAVIDKIVDQKLFPTVQKHSEMYKISGANVPTRLERFTAPIFGIASRGAHATAYVKTAEGLKIWVARRSPNINTYPNKLDSTVAGGIKADQTPFECISAEAGEEASLPSDTVFANMQATGLLTYLHKTPADLVRPDILYVFDLELPDSVIPKPGDEEVAEFKLMTVEEIKDAMFKQEFKPNSALVMIDFFIRHDITYNDNEKHYVEIAHRMRRRLPVPTASST